MTHLFKYSFILGVLWSSVLCGQTFTEIETGFIPLGGAFAWGDYDNDGDLDVFISGAQPNDGPIFLYRNDLSNQFVNAGINLGHFFEPSIALGDYNNDGYLDILLGEHVTVLRNNLEGDFISVASFRTTASTIAQWYDYDNDGKLDIIVIGQEGGRGQPRTWLYHNDNDDKFSEVSAGLIDMLAGSIDTGDFDNDGDFDLLLTGSDFSEFLSIVYRNDNGTLVNIGAELAGVHHGTGQWGDYDNDGDLDILLTGVSDPNNLTPTTKIYRNDDGLFSDIGAELPVLESGDAAWGDFNNDGNLDVLLGGWDGNARTSRLLRNEGQGVFSEVETNFVDLTSDAHLAFMDYDNDGKIDVFISGRDQSTNLNKIYRNNIAVMNQVPSKPTGLSAIVIGDSVVVSWSPSTDNESGSSGLTYNLRVGTTAAGIDVVAPMSDVLNGYRRVISQGIKGTRKGFRLSDGIYFWSVQAIDQVFAGSDFADEHKFKVDTTPPQRPEGLMSRAVQATIALHWAHNTEEDLAFYRIHRALVPAPLSASVIDSVLKPDTSYIDTDVIEDTTYYYWLTAVDSSNNQSELSDTTSSKIPGPVSVESPLTLPKDVMLSQNYPNPFNPGTIISFSIPRRLEISLTIYNIQGRIVRKLIERNILATGHHKIMFDAQGLAGGLYLCRLEGINFTKTRKLILLK